MQSCFFSRLRAPDSAPGATAPYWWGQTRASIKAVLQTLLFTRDWRKSVKPCDRHVSQSQRREATGHRPCRLCQRAPPRARLIHPPRGRGMQARGSMTHLSNETHSSEFFTDMFAKWTAQEILLQRERQKRQEAKCNIKWRHRLCGKRESSLVWVPWST